MCTPSLAKALSHLSPLRCAHSTHEIHVGGQKADQKWSSRHCAAYPDDLNRELARALSNCYPRPHGRSEPARNPLVDAVTFGADDDP
eukprot:603978-Pleurochrysis_carterae.AAC.1